MKLELIERVLKSSKKVNVVNFPVGVEIYLLNPFRICNISPDGDWNSLGTKLKTGFNRFMAFSKIKKLEKAPIGSDKDILFSEAMQAEFNKIKASLDKPHAKLVWKIFWLNHLQDVYDKLPRDAEAIEIRTMSDHSKAVIYHFLAINDSFNLLEDPKSKLNVQFWEKALEYWNNTLNDEKFMGEISDIIETEKKAGNFELRDYSVEKLLNELIEAIFNTLLFVPLKLIEQDLSNSKADSKRRSECISKFLGLILKSDLGTEKLRYELAKQLSENKISKEVTIQFSEVAFKQWADKGLYRKLYDVGMEFIDKIHEITELLKDEAHDKNIHTSTFLTEVPGIPNIHARVISPLLEGIESLKIGNSQSASRELKDKTFFTQLILSLRILTELNIDVGTQGVLIKNVNDINKRFSFNKLTKDQVQSLNSEKTNLKELVNCDICDKYYLLQYCYFINGEYADPDASLYKIYETHKGIVKFTNYTFIPRSKLAADFHNSKINLDVVTEKMRNKVGKDELISRLDELKNTKPQLEKSIADLELKLQPFFTERNNIVKKFSARMEDIAAKIKVEQQNSRKGTSFLTKIRPIEIEMNKKQSESDNMPEKQNIDKLKKKKRVNSNVGGILLVLSVVYFIGSIVSFHFFGLLGLIIIGFIGLVLIGNSEEAVKKIKVEEKKIEDRVKKITKEIEKLKLDLKNLERETDLEVEQLFKPEIHRLEEAEKEEINIYRSQHDIENIEYAKNEVSGELKKVIQEIESINNTLSNKDLVKKQQTANNHPIAKYF